MDFRFTLSNIIAGTQVINEPDGWKGIKIKLERDKNYHSLIEMIDTQFFFYNANNLVDGGRQYLTSVEDTQGLNAVVGLLIEITEDGNTWDDVFTGNLDLSTIKDISRGDKFYKFQCAIIPSDLWSMFLNRKSIEIDLLSTTDLDGNSVSIPITNILALPTQLVRKKSYYTIYQDDWASYPLSIDYDGTNRFYPLDLPKITFDELNTKFNYNYGNTASPDDPSAAGTVDLELMNTVEGGDYTFDITFYLSSTVDAVAGFGNASWLIYFEINKDAKILFTRTALGTGGVDGRDRHTYSGTHTLIQGDRIKIYFEYGGAIANTVYVITPGDITIGVSYISIIGDTSFYPSVATSLILYDAAESLLKRMTASQFNLYSEYLGGFDSSQYYAANGCGHSFAIMKGLHVRGYTFAEKPFSMSFDNWWEGSNPIFNLGLGPEILNGVEVLRIEQKDHFYDDNPILYFDYVNDIERSYDQDEIIKSVKIGYQTRSAESGSGIDDFQTSHTYSTLYKIIGKDVSLFSSFVAASLAIEQTRRNRKLAGVDWRLDNNIMIIALNSNDASPETFTVEVGSPFTSITNLLNATTRYNIRLSVYRNFQRWIKYFSGSLQAYLSSVFKFTGGEGNYTMAVGANSDTCDTGTWTENQDISPSSSFYFTTRMYAFKVPLEWSDYKLLRDNRHRCIAVSQTAANHKLLHISTLAYDIQHASATITGWIKENPNQGLSGLIVALANSNVMTSLDGITWTLQSVSITGGQKLAYGNGVFVAMTVSTTHFFTSPDGIIWTSRNVTSGLWTKIAFGNSIFVAVANISNKAQISTDGGVTWGLITLPLSSSYFCIAFGAGLFVTIGQSGINNEVLTSPDGVTWTVRSQPILTSYFALAFGEGFGFVAIENSDTGKIITSPDGITWTSRTPVPTSINWVALAFGNGIFVALSYNSTDVMRSTDGGITWTLGTSAAAQSWFDITFHNGLFIGLSANGGTQHVQTSPDGITWTLRTTPNFGWAGIANKP